jgi:alpha-ketoglutarate-dependent taurine dioxygenase
MPAVAVSHGVGDVVMRDNLSMLHSATPTDPADARTLRRITVEPPADEPV